VRGRPIQSTITSVGVSVGGGEEVGVSALVLERPLYITLTKILLFPGNDRYVM